MLCTRRDNSGRIGFGEFRSVCRRDGKITTEQLPDLDLASLFATLGARPANFMSTRETLHSRQPSHLLIFSTHLILPSYLLISSSHLAAAILSLLTCTSIKQIWMAPSIRFSPSNKPTARFSLPFLDLPLSLFPDADNTGQLELSEFQAFIDGPEPLCSPDVAYGATGERTLVAANTCHQLPLPSLVFSPPSLCFHRLSAPFALTRCTVSQQPPRPTAPPPPPLTRISISPGGRWAGIA